MFLKAMDMQRITMILQCEHIHVHCVKSEVTIHMDYDKILELDGVTLQDCGELYDLKGIDLIIDYGRIINFVKA